MYTAAQGYFGKSLGELTLRECAMLAGTCNSPYYYNPRRNFYTRQKEGVDYPAITNDRTNYVLRCMYENQYITYEQYQEALDPATAHVLEKDPNTSTGMYAYAHYVEYAVDEVIDILLQLNNLEDTSANRNAMENKLRTGGYHVQLAIDTSIQSTVEDTLENWTNYPTLRDPAEYEGMRNAIFGFACAICSRLGAFSSENSITRRAYRITSYIIAHIRASCNGRRRKEDAPCPRQTTNQKRKFLQSAENLPGGGGNARCCCLC